MNANESIKESDALLLLKDIRQRIIKNEADAKVLPSEIESLIEKWNSWVLDNELYSLGISSYDVREIKELNSIAKTIERIKRSSDGSSLLATIRYLCIKNDYYNPYLMKAYFSHE